MRGYVLIAIFMMSLSMTLKAQESCLPGMPAAPALLLASQAMTAAQVASTDPELSPEFCEAYKGCGQEECLERTMGWLEKPSCGMSKEERMTLTLYMGSGYRCINGFIWNAEDRPATTQLLVETLDRALTRFPRYQGFVARGALLPPAILEQHVKGATVTYDAFTSTSTNVRVAENFGLGSGASMFLIYSQTGRPIMSMGIGGFESEVLFPSNTKFRVVSAKEEDGKHFFIMREVTKEESPKKAAQEDEKIIQLAQASTSETGLTPFAECVAQNGWSKECHKLPNVSADSYKCPSDLSKIPEIMKQEIVPRTNSFLP